MELWLPVTPRDARPPGRYPMPGGTAVLAIYDAGRTAPRGTEVVCPRLRDGGGRLTPRGSSMRRNLAVRVRRLADWCRPRGGINWDNLLAERPEDVVPDGILDWHGLLFG